MPGKRKHRYSMLRMQRLQRLRSYCIAQKKSSGNPEDKTSHSGRFEGDDQAMRIERVPQFGSLLCHSHVVVLRHVRCNYFC